MEVAEEDGEEGKYKRCILVPAVKANVDGEEEEEEKKEEETKKAGE